VFDGLQPMAEKVLQEALRKLYITIEARGPKVENYLNV
jgi:hypothetical protein